MVSTRTCSHGDGTFEGEHGLEDHTLVADFENRSRVALVCEVIGYHGRFNWVMLNDQNNVEMVAKGHRREYVITPQVVVVQLVRANDNSLSLLQINRCRVCNKYTSIQSIMVNPH